MVLQVDVQARNRNEMVIINTAAVMFLFLFLEAAVIIFPFLWKTGMKIKNSELSLYSLHSWDTFLITFQHSQEWRERRL